jgi:hypothetical protein
MSRRRDAARPAYAQLFAALVPADLHSARSATGAAAKNTKAPGRRAVTKLLVVAELLFFRPLKRAGDVLAFPQPQSRDWGYPCTVSLVMLPAAS